VSVCPHCGKPIILAKPESTPPLFPDHLTEHLTVSDEGKYFVVKATHFLGKDMFGEVAGLVKKLGGEYVSMGKQSHFRIPKQR